MIAARGLLATLVALLLIASACTADARPTTDPSLSRASAEAVVGTLTTVSVYVSDQGFDPPSIDLYVGEQVQLVLRNIGRTEYHYKVVDLRARDIFWLDQGSVDYTGDAPPPAATTANAASVSGQHDHDHNVGALVPMSFSQSASGVQRWADEVHAWAYAGKMDVIVFTPTKAGTYAVQDPLHAQRTGRVIVH